MFRIDGNAEQRSMQTVNIERQISKLRYVAAFLDFEAKALRLRLRLKAGFRPDQLRVPAGNPDGGQWTDEDGTPTRVQSRGPRGTSMRRIGGRVFEITPRQATRLEISHAQMQSALKAVRKVDPNWRPTPQAYETVEGLISANETTAREAQARVDQLRGLGIGRGRFTGEEITARGRGRSFTKEERARIDEIGRATGCHTCGTKEPGTSSGHFVPDHQLPSALSPARQSLLPQCLPCSLRQGAWLTNNIGRK